MEEKLREEEEYYARSHDEASSHAQKWSTNLPGNRIIIPIGRVLKI